MPGGRKGGRLAWRICQPWAEQDPEARCWSRCGSSLPLCFHHLRAHQKSETHRVPARAATKSPVGRGGPRAACAHELHTQEGSVQVARVGRPVSPGQPRAPSLPCVWPVSSPGPKPSSGRSSEAGLVGQFPRPRGQGPPYPTLGLRSSQGTGQGIDCLSSPNLLGYFWAGGGWDDSRTFRGWIPATKILSKSRKTSTRGGVSSGPKPSWPAQRWGLVCICKGTRGCLSGQCCLPPPSPGMRTGSLIEDGHNQMVTPDPKACGGPQVIADQSEGSQ